MDIRRRIDRLIARVDRSDDYGQLLASGQVVHRQEDVDDIEAWRVGVRRGARADKIKVRTGFDRGIVWALRVRPDQPEWQAEIRRFCDLRSRTVPLAMSCATNRLLPSGTETR